MPSSKNVPETPQTEASPDGEDRESMNEMSGGGVQQAVAELTELGGAVAGSGHAPLVPASPNQVDIHDLAVVFAHAPDGRPAVIDVTLSVPAGQFATIVGPSGCGKSTVLNCVAGLVTPAAGTVHIGGVPVRGTHPSVGYLFQGDSLLPWKSVLGNVMLPLTLRHVKKREAEERARAWIERVGLGGFENYFPHQLSGGMRKRVALATVFVYEPSILLMDEPFSALDVQTRMLMENELLELWSEQRSTVLFVTHDLEEAVGLADRVLVFTAGPGTIKADYPITLPRPRALTEIRFTEDFQEHYEAIWQGLRAEVLSAYDRDTRGRDMDR